MKKFKILSKKIVLDSKWCPIERQIVRLPNGRETEWFVNTSPDAVVVIPILRDGKICMLKNYKHGCGEIIFEFPAGIKNFGESEINAASRELNEEAGLVGDFKKIGETFANPTGAKMKYHFFVAQNCKFSRERFPEDTEQIEVFFVKNFDDAKRILSKKTSSSATTSAVFFVEKFFRKNAKL